MAPSAPLSTTRPRRAAVAALRRAILHTSAQGGASDLFDTETSLHDAFAQVDPLDLWVLTPVAKTATSPRRSVSLLLLALASGNTHLAQIAVERAHTARIADPALHVFPFPFSAWTGPHLPDGIALWTRLFGPQPALSQAVWLQEARAAIQQHRPDALRWIGQQDGLWGPDAATTLDVLHLLASTHCTDPHTLEAMRALGADAWTRFDRIHGDSILPCDPRQRREIDLWIMGCLRYGWHTPSHSRIDPFPRIVATAGRSAHNALACFQALGAWEDWIGLDHHRCLTKLSAILDRLAPEA